MSLIISTRILYDSGFNIVSKLVIIKSEGFISLFFKVFNLFVDTKIPSHCAKLKHK